MNNVWTCHFCFSDNHNEQNTCWDCGHTRKSSDDARRTFDALPGHGALQGRLGLLPARAIVDPITDSKLLTAEMRDNPYVREIHDKRHRRNREVLRAFGRGCRNALALVGIGSIIAAMFYVAQH